MKKLIITISFSLFVVLSLVSCDSKTVQELSPEVTNPTYTVNIKPVMEAKCVSCHGTQYPTLDNYADVKDAALNGELVCRVQGTCNNVMPPGAPLSSATTTMIAKWVTNNCPE